MSERIRVLVTDKIQTSGLAALLDDPRFHVIEEHDSTTEDFRRHLAQSDGLMVRSATKVRGDLIEAAPRLRVVGRAGVGVDNIDIPACTERGIAVLNAPAGNTISAAELTLALILSVVRRVAVADASMRTGEWARSRFKGIELRGRTLGLIGGGRIGSEVGKRCRAFGMKVRVHDPFLSEDKLRQYGFEPAELDEVVTTADVLSLHVPLNPQTRGLFDEERLRTMKAGAVLVNVARGGVVDEAALARVLEDGHLSGAALDVYAEEPLPEDSPLRAAPNIVLTPHLGASTGEAQEKVAEEIASSVAAALGDGDLSAALNAPGVGGEALRRVSPIVQLAGRLGRLGAAMTQSPIEAVDVRYAGSIDEGLNLLPRHVLVGVLQPALGESVNVVNAGVLAEQRGIRASVTKTIGPDEYAEHVELCIHSGDHAMQIHGAILGPGHPRIVDIDGYAVSVNPKGYVIVLRNHDVPGVIGRVGSLLGEKGINIAGYAQSRREEGGDALAAIRVDDPVDHNVLEALRTLPEVESAVSVDLG